jgi:hypothetical protein
MNSDPRRAFELERSATCVYNPSGSGFTFSKELDMGHIVRIQSDEQYSAAINVLDFVKGTWQGVGPSSAPLLLVTDEQYNALVLAGVVPANGKEITANGKKTPAKKAKS